MADPLDIGLGAGEVINLQQLIRNDQNIWQTVLNDTANGQEQLRTLLQAADGIQYSADHLSTARHQSNVLFNILRVECSQSNMRCGRQIFCSISNSIIKKQLMYQKPGCTTENEPSPPISAGCRRIHPSLYRLAMEYLLSVLPAEDMEIRAARGMNSTSIPRQKPESSFLTTKETGVTSFRTGKPLPGLFPEYTSAMIARFLNATTADGYNPLPDQPRRYGLGDRRPERSPGRTSAIGVIIRSSICSSCWKLLNSSTGKTAARP